MAYDRFRDPFVRQALEAIDGWAADGLTVEHIGSMTWRVKAKGPDCDQDLFLRVTPSASYIEPYLAEPSDDEVATLRQRFASEADVIFPYLRGGRGRGALLRVRTIEDLAAAKDIVLKRRD